MRVQNPALETPQRYGGTTPEDLENFPGWVGALVDQGDAEGQKMWRREDRRNDRARERETPDRLCFKEESEPAGGRGNWGDSIKSQNLPQHVTH